MKEQYTVVHPLDDHPEEKVDVSAAGAMKMTRSVKWALFALRAYLILIMILIFYHVFTLATKGH
jgi:hypothetical protein